MREIKFRAWDKEKKLILPDYDNWIDFSGKYWTSPDRTFNTPNQEIVRESEVIVMQYTGLKDKNGKEIYEGDIVNGLRGVPAIVEWDEGAYYALYKTKRPDMYGFFLKDFHHKIEVIGNIYENPDLLKGGE